MNANILNIKSLKVFRVRGFETSGFALEDFKPGLNLVYGPNATGKSTTAELLQRALWAIDLRAEDSYTVGLELPDGSWQLDIVGGRRQVRKEGHEAEFPPMPSETERDRYRMGLKELLEGLSGRTPFEEIIAKEAMGGVDLDSAANSLDYEKCPARPRRPGNLNKTVQDAEASQRSLEGEERALERLKRKLTEAREAGEQAGRLDKAHERAKLLTELQEKQERLDQLPTLTAKVNEEDRSRLDGLDIDIEAETRTQEQAGQESQRAEEEIERTGLPEKGVPYQTLETLRELRDSLVALDGERSNSTRDVEAVSSELDAKGNRLPEGYDPDQLPILSETSLDAIENADSDVRQAKSVLGAETAERERLGELRVVEETRPLEAAIEALAHWFEQQKATGKLPFTWLISLIGLLLILAGVFSPPVPSWIVIVVGFIISVGALVLAFMKSSPSNVATALAEETLARLEIDPPEEWTSRAVAAHIQVLTDRVLRAQDNLAHNQRVEEARRRERVARDNHEQASQAFTDAVQKAGLGRPEGSISTLHLARVLHDWQGAYDRHKGSLAVLEKVTGEFSHKLSEWRGKITAYSEDPGETIEEIKATMATLERRVDAHREAMDRRNEATRNAEAAGERRAKRMKERTKLLRRMELTDALEQAEEVRHQLAYALEHRAEYLELDRAVNTLRGRIDSLTSELEAYPALLEFDEVHLQTMLQEQCELAGRQEELTRQITKIETRVADAKRAHSLEEALAARDAEVEALGRKVDQGRCRLLGNILVGHLRERAHRENLPAVFNRARNLFLQVTNGSFELDFDPRTKRFAALDTQFNRVRSLNELSDGTRLQLLVCVRIAFIEQQERGLVLPLLLDELLANSDDERAERLVDAFTAIQQAGRQILYFTAQWDEVLKWQRIAQKQGVVDVPVFRMENALRNARELVTGLLEESTPAPELVDAADLSEMSHGAFAMAASVPTINPRDGVRAVPLWYLTRDVELLAQLYGNRITSYGQASALRSNGLKLGMTDEQWQSIELCARLYTFTLRYWLQGRGQPVTEEILRQSGVSPAFMDRVIDIAIEYGWDARAILDGAKSLPRFREETLNQMREAFEEKGCLEDTPILTREEVRTHLLNSMSTEINSGEIDFETIDWVLDTLYPSEMD